MDALIGKKCLVTGGAGFVGSRLSMKLFSDGAEVTVVDNYKTGRIKNLAGTGVEIVRQDIRDDEFLKTIVDYDYIFHLATINITLSMTEPLEDFEVNVVATVKMLLEARKSTRLKNFIYTSSASVYGTPPFLPVSETSPTYTSTPYAASKLAAENYCVSYWESFGLPISIVRYSNVYGPGQRPENPYCGVVAKFCEASKAGKPHNIYDTGEQTRDFTYVDDAVRATILAAIGDRSKYEIFNVGTGIETSVIRLSEMVKKAYGDSSESVFIESRHIDNIRRRVMNIEKARRILRWTPEISLAKGLKLTKEYYE
jgi:UDP-glucose 4-epimerase